MIVAFPSLKALELALAAGAIPPATAVSPVRATASLEGPVRLRPRKNLSRASLERIAFWGGAAVNDDDDDLTFEATCWAQLIPLAQESAQSKRKQPQPDAALFVLPDPKSVAALAGEMLRLGNDRQSVRTLPGDSLAPIGETLECSEQPVTLLRVVDPPYYTLQRAADEGVSVFFERAPGVWAAWGHRHPLESRIQPAKGQIVLLSPDRRWIFLPDAPFRDIYEAVDFILPSAAVELAPRQLDSRIQVPLRLIPNNADGEPAQLWVLPEGFDAVSAFVHNADDQLLSRLSFAVASASDRSPSGDRAHDIIILRARPSKEPPPVLDFGLALRPYLKLANLFVPCQWRLHPPLRRDMAASLLAPDPEQVTWLRPDKGGAFLRESLPDSAFRPLPQWIEYVFDRDQPHLEAWVASCQFDFEDFVALDSPAAPARFEAGPVLMPTQRKGEVRRATAGARTERRAAKQEQSSLRQAAKADEPAPDQARTAATAVAEPHVSALVAPIEVSLRDAEMRLFQDKTPLDSPHRADQWRELAELYSRVGQPQSAAICWSASVWEREETPRDDADRSLESQDWLALERLAHPDPADSSAREQALERILSVKELKRVAGLSAPDPVEACRLASGLILEAAQVSARRRTELAPHAARFLERHEHRLPVRTAWLAWKAVGELSGEDVLTIARARDRLLGQLHRFGLRPSLDVVPFVHTPQSGHGEQHRELRSLASLLQRDVASWLAAAAPAPSGRTGEYVDLLFAVAFARLGEPSTALELVEHVRRSELNRESPELRPAHEWLRDAFAFRVEQATGGEPAGPLGEPLLERLQRLNQSAEKRAAYMAERMREHILLLDSAGRSLRPDRTVTGIEHPPEDASAEKLLAQVRKSRANPAQHGEVLARAIDAAARFGHRCAAELLEDAVAWLEGKSSTTERTLADRAHVLGRAIQLAAHFGDNDHFLQLAVALKQDMPRFVAAFLADPRRLASKDAQHAAHETMAAVEGLFKGVIRGLRKLGPTDQMLQIVGALEEACGTTDAKSRTNGRSPAASGDRIASDLAASRRLTLQMHIAAACFHFGDVRRGESLLREAFGFVAHGGMTPLAKTNVLCRYAETWGHAPLSLAGPALRELFQVTGEAGGLRRRLPPMEEQHRTIRSEDACYSLLDLRVVDAVLYALAGEEFLVSEETRRWLDEEEFLIRRRMHRDVRRALAHPS